MTMTRSPGRPVFLGLVLAGSVLVLLLHAWSFGFEIDDAYISFRYAQNLVDGHGLVFNPGEPVEGYTNLAWVLLSALGIALGIEPLLFARVLGTLASIGVLLLAPIAVRRLAPTAGATALAAPVLLAACGPLACWTLAGLETPLVALLALGTFLCALTAQPLLTGVLALALALTRPDGVALGGAFLLWSVLACMHAPGRTRARAIGGGALFALGVLAHFVWRHETYGAWLPNTYYAKTGDLAGQLRSGVPYALDFARAFLAPWVGVAAWSAVASRGAVWRDPRVRATLAVLGGWIVYVIAVGGDGLGMFRFFVPILPILTVLGVALLHHALTGSAAGGIGAPSTTGRTEAPVEANGRTAAVVTLAIAAFTAISSMTGNERALVTAHMSGENLAGWKLAGDTLARVLPEGTTIALAPVGYIPYRTGLVTYDILGLTDPAIARREMDFEIGYAGHEKHDGARILSRHPDYLLLGNVDVTAERRRGVIPPFRPELDIYRNPDFARDYESVSIPLDGGGFLNCYRLRALRAPREAGEARDP